MIDVRSVCILYSFNVLFSVQTYLYVTAYFLHIQHSSSLFYSLLWIAGPVQHSWSPLAGRARTIRRVSARARACVWVCLCVYVCACVCWRITEKLRTDTAQRVRGGVGKGRWRECARAGLERVGTGVTGRRKRWGTDGPNTMAQNYGLWLKYVIVEVCVPIREGK